MELKIVEVELKRKMTRRKINPNIEIFQQLYKNSKPKCKGLKKKVKRVKTDNRKSKENAWKVFSRYIRLRDCLKTTKTDHMGVCYTCGKTFDFKELQAGHCISGRGNFILLDEECVKIQCYRCNIELKGNYDIFIPKIIRDHSLKWFEEKKRLSRLPFKRDWEVEKEIYKEKYNNLKKITLPF